jgi:hypothetical protein
MFLVSVALKDYVEVKSNNVAELARAEKDTSEKIEEKSRKTGNMTNKKVTKR